jgi:hypothetical protein
MLLLLAEFPAGNNRRQSMNNYRELTASAFRNAALVATLASVSFAPGFALPARACGLLGCIINQVAPGAGDALDKMHNDMGRPLDHAANIGAGVAADVIVPGSGPAVTTGLETLDQYNHGN